MGEVVTKAFDDLTGIAPVLTLSLILNVVLILFVKWLILSDKEKMKQVKEVDDKRIADLTDKIIDLVGKK
jgi:hypothetical protein